MILNAYCIYDLKACVYHPPFYFHTDAAAARALSDTVNDSSTNISRHPADYVLYRVGTFDDASGRLEPLSPRHHVADANAFVQLAPVPLFPDQKVGIVSTTNTKANGAL